VCAVCCNPIVFKRSVLPLGSRIPHDQLGFAARGPAPILDLQTSKAVALLCRQAPRLLPADPGAPGERRAEDPRRRLAARVWSQGHAGKCPNHARLASTLPVCCYHGSTILLGPGDLESYGRAPLGLVGARVTHWFPAPMPMRSITAFLKGELLAVLGRSPWAPSRSKGTSCAALAPAAGQPQQLLITGGTDDLPKGRSQGSPVCGVQRDAEVATWPVRPPGRIAAGQGARGRAPRRGARHEADGKVAAPPPARRPPKPVAAGARPGFC